MDINSLLSPQELPRKSPLLSTKAPAKKPRKSRTPRQSSTIRSATLSTPTLPPSSLPFNASVHIQHTITSPLIASPSSALGAGTSDTPPAEGLRATRQPSTPGMDTLADLASMQHHQQTARTNAGGLRSAEIYEHQNSSASVLSNAPALSRPQPAVRGAVDLSMADAPNRTPPPRRYSANSLSEAEIKKVAQLITYLATNPFAYESHVQLVKLLHQGLVSHMHAHSSSTSPGDPHDYDLLQDLQSAREAMNTTFAMGEDLWVEWIEDQKILAVTLEDKISVIESCEKAVQEETGSISLWTLYAEWMLSLYKTANPDDKRFQGVGEPLNEAQGWSEDDKVVAREVCSKQQMLEVWRRGVQDTKWRINDSHILWDQYAQLLIEDLTNLLIESGIGVVRSHFMDRLRIPHATWDQTFQNFSSFISRFYNISYEDMMVTANRQGLVARSQYSLRESLESDLQRARDSDDKGTEWRLFNEYIDWEMSQSRKKNAFSFELVHTLYQRATLRFPTDTNFWEGFVMFLIDETAIYGRNDVSVLAVLERATGHCPWSGTLWSQHILAAERDSRPSPDIHHIKHKATSTGLLDAGDMAEILKVHTAWCGFLRRRAFDHNSTDEDIDVAEVGIRSAIEDMETVGRSKYGDDYQGDAEYRLERIYIKYLSQSGKLQDARDAWKALITKRGDSYDFWICYYLWEMGVWGNSGYGESNLNGSQGSKPMESTRVLRLAMNRPKLDWPEKIIEVFQYHCEDHESVEELQSAVLQIWKTKHIVKRRREKEALEAYTLSQAQGLQQQQVLQGALTSEKAKNIGKRKREDEGDRPQTATKKSRPHDNGIDPDPAQQSLLAPTSLKRDRENSTVIVKNLPFEATEIRVRQYFRDCGTINTLKLLPSDDGDSTTATIEFDSKEDVLTALTKDLKIFDGRPIEVQVESGSTLFVTNFPPTADAEFLREKFVKFGEVIDIRFPSLKKNTHRRFCYVQFKSSSQAQAAIALDGEILEDLKLSVKISNPAQKQDRTGAIYEGREIYLANLAWSITEDELSQIFSKYGKVEKVRIPIDAGGKSKGFGYVVFSNEGDATAALDMNLTKVKNRLLNVSLAASSTAKRQTTTIITAAPRLSHSPTPKVPSTNGDADQTGSPTYPTYTAHRLSSDEIHSRTIALLHIPDTVNDTRIRALAEPYGALVKVVLRHDHQGAIIEYKDVASAGRAALGIDGHEIIPGRKLTVGSVREMLLHREEMRSDKIGARSSNAQKESNETFQGSAPIKRPVQPGAGGRRGGRGGLGVKRAGAGLTGLRGPTDRAGKVVETGDSNATDGKAKSNADFKAMFLKKS